MAGGELSPFFKCCTLQLMQALGIGVGGLSIAHGGEHRHKPGGKPCRESMPGAPFLLLYDLKGVGTQGLHPHQQQGWELPWDLGTLFWHRRGCAWFPAYCSVAELWVITG